MLFWLLTIGCSASWPQQDVQRLMNRVGTAFLRRYVAGRPVTDAQLGLHDESPEYVVVGAPSRSIPLMPLGVVAPIARTANATYHAELSCHGTTIEARLNGTTVASVSDNTSASGQI